MDGLTWAGARALPCPSISGCALPTSGAILQAWDIREALEEPLIGSAVKVACSGGLQGCLSSMQALPEVSAGFAVAAFNLADGRGG